jgi:hypothetical protein
MFGLVFPFTFSPVFRAICSKAAILAIAVAFAGEIAIIVFL